MSKRSTRTYAKALRADVGCKLYGPTKGRARFRIVGSSGHEVTGRAVPLDRPEDPIWEEERQWANDQFDRAVAWARAQAKVLRRFRGKVRRLYQDLCDSG